MKDNFSTQSDDYVKYRPQYPKELLEYLLSITNEHFLCWDCGTGNGQLAVKLAEHFEVVEATDISEKQLLNASARDNIIYSKQPAEQTTFPDSYFDLITVAQAAHWFDFDRFNPEVKRTLNKGGIIALFGYGLVKVPDPVGSVLEDFYWNITKPYWDPERLHIEAKYETIPFPFDEIDDVPYFAIEKSMTIEELTGYISTWSAVQHFKKDKGYSPIRLLNEELSKFGELGVQEVKFPIFTRIGRL